MNLKSLWQPHHPVFWLMVVFNILSSVCAWALRNMALPYPVMLLIGLVALCNVAGGLWCAWLLLQKKRP
jgi:4-hydroxybenzoate polyprenyltransferase